MKEKILQIFNKISEKVKPILILIDEKITTLIPNPKIKKVTYIGVGSLFGFMFLIIILGILISPFKNVDSDDTTIIKKPNTIFSSPEPKKELSEMQKEILKLENEINSITFPESELNIPVIERDLVI